jgi:hypothetical protein
MSSTEQSILSRVKTDLVAIDGSGSYNYDFSGADQVSLALAIDPLRVPGVYISPLTTSTSQNAGRTPMNRYDREMVLQIDVFVPTTSSAPGTAILAALDAQSDIMRAIENDRSLGGLVHDVAIDASAYDGAELDRPRMGVSTLRLKINYSEIAGS